MSDVLWAAVIASGVSVVGNATTGWVAFVTTRHRALSESDRLREEHREADRRVRRDAYERLLIAIEQLDAMTSAYTPDPTQDDFTTWLSEFRAAGVQVGLVQSEPVKLARQTANRVLDEIPDPVMKLVEQGVPIANALGDVYVPLQARLHDAGRALSIAMHDDLSFAPDTPASASNRPGSLRPSRRRKRSTPSGS